MIQCIVSTLPAQYLMYTQPGNNSGCWKQDPMGEREGKTESTSARDRPTLRVHVGYTFTPCVGCFTFPCINTRQKGSMA